MIPKYDYADGDLPKTLKRYVDLDDVPDDLITRIASEYVVKAECQHCGHVAYYADTESVAEPECKSASCSEQILLP